MLRKPNRLTDGTEYRGVVRRGVRCSGRHTITYVVTNVESSVPRFGFIVSKQVGAAVTRNTVRRRLKAVCAEELAHVRADADVVIRALPSASTASFQDLRSDVIRSLARRAA